MEPHEQPFDKLRVFLNVEIVPSEVEGARGLLRRRIKLHNARQKWLSLGRITTAVTECHHF